MTDDALAGRTCSVIACGVIACGVHAPLTRRRALVPTVPPRARRRLARAALLASPPIARPPLANPTPIVQGVPVRG